MNCKRWSILLLAAVMLTLTIFAGIMLLLDPVLNYGPEKSITPYYHNSTLYTNPGIARHYKYDTVLVGTSMIQNTDVDLCEEVFGCTMVRLPYSGGTTFDMKTILELCFDSGNRIQTVLWELDQFQITGNASAHRYPVPEYLYNDSLSDDLSYLLNLDVMYHYGLNYILGSLRGQVSKAERRSVTLYGTYGTEAVLAGYSRPGKAEQVSVFENSPVHRAVDANLQNITALVSAHPETDFVFFMPPFSVLYWDREVQNGTFEASLDATAYALRHLLEYSNVSVYYYQGETDIVSNLDNYKDYSHYCPRINDLLTTYLAEERNRVTPENLDSMIAALKEYIDGFNFEALLAT